MKNVLVTGSAGFIGFHLSSYLLNKGYTVFGLDGFTSYYDVQLKRERQNILSQNKNFVSLEGLLENIDFLEDFFSKYKVDLVFHLAAQAGVRYSMENPKAYINSNIVGTFNLLECLKRHPCEHFLFASTSSIYGESDLLPFKEIHKTDSQISFYAATKKACEVLTHSYAHLYKIPTSCFRFFTVYGPWGRPDMALFKFTDLILKEDPIDVYNNGNLERDFTYIDDLISSIYRLSKVIPGNKKRKKISNHDSLSMVAPWRVVNIGSSSPLSLMKFIEVLEECLGRTATKKFLPAQKGDVAKTYADNSLITDLIGETTITDPKKGIENFVLWYLKYYKKIKV